MDRPDEKSLLKQFRRRKYGTLAAGILVDLIGMSSYTLPLVGESTDLVVGPLSGLACWWLHGQRLGGLGGVFAFLEEIGPGTDWVPTLSLVWVLRYVVRGDKTRQEFLDQALPKRA